MQFQKRTEEDRIKSIQKYKEDNETMARWNTFEVVNTTFKCVPGYEFYESILEAEEDT